MYTLLILFFVSLLGITFMIGRKLLMLDGGEIVIHKEEELFQAPLVEEWKNLTTRNIRRFGYITLVAIVRSYLKTTNFLKNIYGEIKLKLQETFNKQSVDQEAKIEVNKFLKMISEYKHKIRRIREKVKEEENL